MGTGGLPPELADAYERAQAVRPDLPPVEGFGPEPDAEPASVPEDGPEPAGNGHGPPPDSLIAELRAQHDRIARRRSEVFALPLWDGKLGARLRYSDEGDFNRLVKAAAASADNPAALMRANANLLIAGCEEVLGRADDSGPWVPLIDGERLRFDARLADVLQLGPVTGARDVLVALFHGPERAQWAIGRLSREYFEWLTGEAPEVADEAGKF